MYTNNGVIPHVAGSGVSVITLRSDEYIRHPVEPTIIRAVNPVLSCVTIEQLRKEHKEKKVTTSRDLKPGRKRPITACVAGKYHRIMPATDKSKKPPDGYAPVRSTQGEQLWQRLPPTLRARQRWMLHHPFIRGWNAGRMRDVDRFQFWFVPITAAGTARVEREESDNSLDVNTDNSEREEELQRFMDGEFIFIVEQPLARQILDSQLSWRSQRVNLKYVIFYHRIH